MSKKIIFATIPMLEQRSLKRIQYRKENNGELLYLPTSFPSVAMIEGCVTGDDEIKIVVIQTNDDANRSNDNFIKFKTELNELAEEMGINLPITDVLILPHEETREKQIELFRRIAAYYETDFDIYLDLTYGTKVTAIGIFSSLVYAEKVKHCNIKQIVYGKYAHDGSDIGNLYDLKYLYELNMIIHEAQYMDQNSIESMLDSLWGESGAIS